MDGGITGFLLKGSNEEKIFPSLDRLIYKHLIKAVSLPVKLRSALECIFQRAFFVCIRRSHIDSYPFPLDLKLYHQYYPVEPQKVTQVSSNNISPTDVTAEQASMRNDIKNNMNSNPGGFNPHNNYKTTKSPVEIAPTNVTPTMVKRTESINSTLSLNTSLASTRALNPIYTCKLVYLGCRDCELLYGSAAIDRSISSLLNHDGNNFKSSSLVELKIQRSGVTLTDEERKLFFRKHFNKRNIIGGHVDPSFRTVNVEAYWLGRK